MERKEFNRQLLSLAVPLALQNLLTALVGASDAQPEGGAAFEGIG